MSSPEIQRRVSQHGNDIDSLYQLLAAVDQKVDALGAQVETGFTESARQNAETNAKLDVILQRLNGR